MKNTSFKSLNYSLSRLKIELSRSPVIGKLKQRFKGKKLKNYGVKVYLNIGSVAFILAYAWLFQSITIALGWPCRPIFSERRD